MADTNGGNPVYSVVFCVYSVIPMKTVLKLKVNSRTKYKDINKDQNYGNRKQNIVWFLRNIVEKQAFLWRECPHGTGKHESPKERNPHHIVKHSEPQIQFSALRGRRDKRHKDPNRISDEQHQEMKPKCHVEPYLFICAVLNKVIGQIIQHKKEPYDSSTAENGEDDPQSRDNTRSICNSVKNISPISCTKETTDQKVQIKKWPKDL